jgi:hypothetical protein
MSDIRERIARDIEASVIAIEEIAAEIRARRGGVPRDDPGDLHQKGYLAGLRVAASIARETPLEPEGGEVRQISPGT